MGKSEQMGMEVELTDATSIESIPDDYPFNRWDMLPVTDEEYVNKITGTRYRYCYYRDPDGRVWYETKVHGPSGWRTQEEAIFGRKIQKKRPAQGRPL